MKTRMAVGGRTAGVAWLLVSLAACAPGTDPLSPLEEAPVFDPPPPVQTITTDQDPPPLEPVPTFNPEMF